MIANDPAEAYFGSPAKWSLGRVDPGVAAECRRALGALFPVLGPPVAARSRTSGGPPAERWLSRCRSRGSGTGGVGAHLPAALLFRATTGDGPGVGLLTLAVLVAMALYPACWWARRTPWSSQPFPVADVETGVIRRFLANYRVANRTLGCSGGSGGVHCDEAAPSQRDQRRLDERRPGVLSRLLLIPNLGVVLGVGVAMACLSLHTRSSQASWCRPRETSRPAQMLLDAPHFARDEYPLGGGLQTCSAWARWSRSRRGGCSGRWSSPRLAPSGRNPSKRGRERSRKLRTLDNGNLVGVRLIGKLGMGSDRS